MPRLGSNRVGVQGAEGGDPEQVCVARVDQGTVDSQGTARKSHVTLVSSKAQRQKELLRQKKHERRAHARQRVAEKARRQEERLQKHEVEQMAAQDGPMRLVVEPEETRGDCPLTELVLKHVQSACTHRTEAAAVTIQKALRKQLKKCQFMFRHSPRIFAEDYGAVDVSNESEPILVASLQDRKLHVVPLLALPQLKPSVSPRNLASSSCSSSECSDEGSYSCSSCSCSCSCSCSSSSSSNASSSYPRQLKLSSSSSRDRQQTARSRRVRHCMDYQPLPLDFEPRFDQTYSHEQHLMVIKIQARVRGCQGRKQALQRSVEFERELQDEALKEVQEEAIVKIQTRARGALVRTKVALSDQTARRHKRHEHVDDLKRTRAHVDRKRGIYDNLDEIGTWPQELDLDVVTPWQEMNDVALTQLGAIERVRVFCGTWNMHAKKPRDDLRLWIRWHQYHIVAVGSEECVRSIAKSVVFTSKKAWEDQLKETLGPEYVLVASHALTAIHNVVFLHTSLVPLLGNIQSDAVATGLGNQLGNKGGVGIAFTLGVTSFVFVNCHFEAHQRNVAKRNGNFHRINHELRLSPGLNTGMPDEAVPLVAVTERKGLEGLGRTSVNRFSMPAVAVSGLSGSKRAISERFDRVFWYGDLNYRINGTRRMVDTLLLRNQYEVLYANDQLQREMKAGNVFPHFQEGPLHFRPTYKFDKRSDVYDSSTKQRIPSWTDRVLYLSNQKVHDIELQSYRSQKNFRTSDHRPVCATFLVTFSATDALQSPPRRGQSRENLATSQACSLQ